MKQKTRSIDLSKVLFLHIAWGHDYDSDDDHTVGSKHKHVEATGKARESGCFLDTNDRYYGASQVPQGTINLENLGADSEAYSLDGATVIWTATAPKEMQTDDLENRRVVGWYNNATVFREEQEPMEGRRWSYNVSCDVQDGFLLPENERTFGVPTAAKGMTGFPGNQASSWFPATKDEVQKEFARSVVRFVRSREAVSSPDRSRGSNGGGRGQSSPEHRKNVEIAAMDVVDQRYTEKGFSVFDVSAENKGWDMEANKGSKTVFLEIKGLSGTQPIAELTPNEYKMMKREKKFRLCIVTQALSDKPKLSIFKRCKKNGSWKSKKLLLDIKERTGAQVAGKKRKSEES